MEQQTKTLSFCVYSVMADLDEVSQRNYEKYLKWAHDGFRRLNVGNLLENTVRTVKLEVDENTKTANLPADFVNFIKIGYSCHGVIINLDSNPELKLSGEPDVCGCQEDIEQCQLIAQGFTGSQTGVYTGDWWYYNSFWHNNQFVGGLYGLGAGTFRNSYRIDWHKNQIQFDSYIKADYVILEYIATGLNDGDAVIQEDVVPCITNYIHWKRVSFDTKINRLEAQMWKRNWEQEVKGLAARNNALTVHDWRQIWRKSMKQIPKR